MTPDPSAWDDRPISTTGTLALFLGGSADSFTGLLLDLIGKADPGRKARLALAFPREVRAYDTWQSMSPAPTFAQLRAATGENGAGEWPGVHRTVAANIVNQVLYHFGELSALVPRGPLRDRVDDETEHAGELAEMIGNSRTSPASVPRA